MAIYHLLIQVINSTCVLCSYGERKNHSKALLDLQDGHGILFPKLFLPYVRKTCSSDRVKLMKFEAKGR